ncbi:unnamed protein product [Spirodela intermedia]|uniref:Uncharacterized protein n=1 Tax=Spirodela intermedia TaxID=51605 RepID=A0A7I8KV03_SPIIN|nr:unnamed protein product [Spirodela intermedia]
MQLAWKTWSHLGSRRSVSPPSNSERQTAHSSAPLLILWSFTSAYTSMGNVSITAGSSPLGCRAPWTPLPGVFRLIERSPLSVHWRM